jgi:hypothetical protein
MCTRQKRTKTREAAEHFTINSTILRIKTSDIQLQN